MRRLEIAGRAYRLAAGSGHTGMEVWCWDWLWMWLGWGGMLVFGWSFMFGLRDHINFLLAVPLCLTSLGWKTWSSVQSLPPGIPLVAQTMEVLVMMHD